MDVQKERERKQRQPRSLKPFNTLSDSMKTKRSRAFSLQIGKDFDNEVSNFYNLLDQPVLQEVKFNVQDKKYVVNYHSEEDGYLDPFIKVIDQGSISQNAYRKLAAIQPELPREYNILDAKQKINEEMNIKIPIFALNIDNIDMSLTTNDPSNDTIGSTKFYFQILIQVTFFFFFFNYKR